MCFIGEAEDVTASDIKELKRHQSMYVIHTFYF